MAKILVTGAAGFIGFHLSKRLLDRGDEVVGLDNLNDYYDVSLKQARLSQLVGRPGFRFVQMDLADRAGIAGLFAGEKFAKVVNLAAQAGVRYSLQNPHAYVDSNLVGFVNILEGCRHSGVEHLVFASSSSVYGANTAMPFSIHHNVDHPVSLYAATKKANELMAHTYSHLYGLPTTGLRFFTVYGPWGRPDMAMWLFTDAMLAGRPIQVFNHGDMRRDFTYVDDIVAGLRGALTAPDLAPYEIFNLGNHRSENLMDMIGILGRTLGVEPKMEMLPMQAGDVPATYADTERARLKLGFEPTTPIRVGIPRFVQWYREYHSA